MKNKHKGAKYLLSAIGIILASVTLSVFFLNFTGLSLGTQFSANDKEVANLRLAAVGDFGCTEDAKKTIQNIQDIDPQLFLALGDFSYKETADCWNDLIKPIEDRTRIVIGNHETESSPLLDQYMSRFNLSKQFYSFNIKNVHFLMMSTETDYSEGSAQFGFVRDDLETAASDPNIQWIIVSLHGYMYASAGGVTHISKDLRAIYHPLFEQYRVDLVLSGHEHNYQRTFPLRYNRDAPAEPIITDPEEGAYTNPQAPLFAIVGTGGVNLYSLPSKAQYIAKQASTYGFLELELGTNGSTLNAAFHANDGTVLDRFSVTKSYENNHPPIAHAGRDQTVLEMSKVLLDGSGSIDADQNYPLSYSWKQTSGPKVELLQPNSAKPVFNAPTLNSSTTTVLSFQLHVTDAMGKMNNSPDSVSVTVRKNPYNYEPFLALTGKNHIDVNSSSTDVSSLQLTKFSVSAWFRTDMKINNASTAVLINKGGIGPEFPGANMNYGIWLTNISKVAAGFEASTGDDYFLKSSRNYGDGLWHFATLTFDGQMLQLFVDGENVGKRNTENAFPDNTGSQPFRIGANSYSGDQNFVGDIDEIRVWSRAISSTEVTDMYIRGKPSQSGQILYMPFAD